MDENGEVLAKGDAGAQTRIAYERVGAILADAGATYQDIVQVRTYLVGTENRQSYLDEREKLFGEIYADRVFPPNTFVFVQELFHPDMLVEIEVIAAIAQ